MGVKARQWSEVELPIDVGLIVIALCFDVFFQHIQRSATRGNRTITTLPEDGLPVIGFKQVLKFFTNLSTGNGFEDFSQLSLGDGWVSLNQKMDVVCRP